MKSLSEATFKKLAGEKAFARGVKLYNQGRVGDLSLDGAKIKATVVGQTDYLVTIHHTERQFEGSCECPASKQFDFCHHCVAVSLAYYYQTQVNQELAEKPSDDKIRGYLETLTKPDLVQELAMLIEQDNNLKDHWTLKSELASGAISAAQIRKRITQAIPYKASGLWRFKEVAHYYQQAHADLSLLADAIVMQSPAAAFKLVVYALQRLEKTSKNIEDNHGYQNDTQQLLVGLFRRVLSIQHWSIKNKVNEMTNLILDPDFTYASLNLPFAYLDVIGERGFDDICDTVKKAWQLLELPEERYGQEYAYYARLETMLVEQAQDKNDQELELQILERGALHVERCLELVYLCIEYQQLDRAEKWLRFSEQLKRLSVAELYDVETAQIALWRAKGELDSATQALWSRFEESESRSDLDKLLDVVANDDVMWLDRAIKLLGSRIEPTDKQAKTQQRVETLACIYIDHGQVEEAKQLHKVFPLRSDVLLYLVTHAALTRSSILLIEEGVNQLLTQAYQNVYQDAINVLTTHFERCPSSLMDDYLSMVTRLYNQPSNKRKTNFVKLLKGHFPQIFNDH